ncbi:prepilin-type N-terminal cleavage/methylation domain-containing protein [Candidatus Pelagibacter sp.]|nr:prepilin-type N-terminal cleavage/methylation domain-containing protein [Candidatus Pelagibacter sp.]|tara:strand:+ start:1413 stop:2345 length:933 start_codon:yes stop_codon:yes gene_type:complete
MIRKNLKSTAGLTLIEILIGIVVSSIMMAAIYTTYSIVNTTYSQVLEKAKVSRSSRDLIELLIRDIRMSGFRYYLGDNELGFPRESYLEFVGGAKTIKESHDPIVIIPNQLGHSITDAIATPPAKHNSNDTCCDKIHIVYDDFNQNDATQPYKRYKLTYFARPLSDGIGDNGPINPRYGIYKSKISWQQPIGQETGAWVSDCSECYHNELIRDHVEDMEFVALDNEGRVLSPSPSTTTEATRNNLYKVRAVDIRLAFISEKPFFRFESREGNERELSGFSRTIRSFSDRYLRDNVVVTVYTRNIVGQDIF